MNRLDEALKFLFFENRRIIYITSAVLLLLGIGLTWAGNRTSDIEREIIRQGLPNPTFSRKESILNNIKFTVKDHNILLIENQNERRDIYALEVGKTFIKVKVPALSVKEVKIKNASVLSKGKVSAVFVD